MSQTIVTLKAAWRPHYFSQVLFGLTQCFDFKYYKYVFLFDLHPSADNTAKLIQRHHIELATMWKELTGVDLTIMRADTNLGCAGSTKYLLESAFSESNCDKVIHLEDDTVPTLDYFKIMDWSMDLIETDEKYFAACPFNRPATREWQPKETLAPTLNSCDKLYTRPWFECGGGFGITRRVWDNIIVPKGGMFGAQGNCNVDDLVGDDWRASIMEGNGGSWAWPMNQYFRMRSREDHLCIYPVVGRVQNIGKEQGRFNPSVEFHQTKIFDDQWIGLQKFKRSHLEYLNYGIDYNMPYHGEGQ